ncbi:uncharacterized protein LOC121602682 [Anopheles merus]|uniref:uncharacterized protein LOC121602682 n=1 Tax=Anopheles merus TaxID=30066 RepID=UPI001BE3D907|nr:uncharacterized protein LOC121602682 [Anopheles merus]
MLSVEQLIASVNKLNQSIMHLILGTLLTFAVLIHAAPGPCELPSLSEVGSQYLVFGQDCRQYAYGYNAGSSAKVELKSADGTVYGAYHYIDANNVTQKVNYTVNDVDGFVVEASNLPAPVKDDVSDALTTTEVPTTLPSVVPEQETTPFKLVRESSVNQSKDRDIYLKPILSVWFPASSYNPDHVVVQHAELSASMQEHDKRV